MIRDLQPFTASHAICRILAAKMLAFLEKRAAADAVIMEAVASADGAHMKHACFRFL